MTKLVEQRKRAIEILFKKADRQTPMLVDYHLDEFCRQALNLPDLPAGQLPYEGWMVGKKQANFSPSEISVGGEALIKRWEGCRLKAYQCSANTWTIGWGHTKGVKRGDRISQAKADALFLEDIKQYERCVAKAVSAPINQNQFDALVSLCYNIGCSAFRHSTLVRLLNQKNYTDAANQFNRWTIAGGRRIQGLVNRRKQEKSLFESR